MSASTDDWKAWASDWQQLPTIDAARLQERARRKRLQMRLVLAFECATALFAASQVAWLWLNPGIPARWKLWSGFAFVLIVAVTCLSIHLRRGSWRALTDSVPDLLRLTAQRARAGIRLAWLNILGILVLLAVTLPVAAPWLAPSRWRDDPHLRLVLALQFGITGPLLLGGLVCFVVYLRRQRRRLRDAEALLRDDAETAAGHA